MGVFFVYMNGRELNPGKEGFDKDERRTLGRRWRPYAERGRSGEAFSVANPCLTANKQKHSLLGVFLFIWHSFFASTLDVILQRLMPPYRLRQSGESTTLLPTATHIDIAVAMALWILGIGTSCGVCHPSMTTKVIRKTGCFYCNRHKLSETRIMSLMRSKIFSQCTN